MSDFCKDCKYYKVCGDDERERPCNGYESKDAVDIDEPVFGTYDYRYLIDMAKADGKYEKGKAKNPNYTYKDAMRDMINDLLKMIEDEVWSDFDEIGDGLAKELERRYK